jgi:hypothetical protein
VIFLAVAVAVLVLCALNFAADGPAVPASAPPASAPAKSHLAQSVSMRKMANAIHAVIAADQRAYVQNVLERQPAADQATSHAAMLAGAAVAIQSRGAEFSFVLRSADPIDPRNAPQTQFEQRALAELSVKPDEPVYAGEELGGRSYFTAVFPERADRQSCVDCHNAQRRPQRSLRSGDVMGALVVRIPLEF